MRELVILSSSTLTPPNPNPSPHNHHYKSKRTSLLKPNKTPLSKHPPISSVQFRPPLLSTVRWDLTEASSSSVTTARLKYYADLASNLVNAGKLEDFLMIIECVIVSGIEPSQFVAALNIELVSLGFCEMIREGKIWNAVEALKSVEKFGVSALKLFDKSSMKVLAGEWCRMVKRVEVEEAVELIEALSDLRLPVKELVKPIDIIKVCVDKCSPDLAVRFANIFPHAQILHCTIINEFGKKGDLRSSLQAFEASQKILSEPNMYAYRTMIDVCGLCGDYMKSRYIYEELLSQKVTPNIYVFNSLMNVNAHDLNYTLGVYKHMQNLGVIADMASFNILLKACCLAGRVDLAQDIYGEVQVLQSKGAMRLDVFTYSTIIKVFADAKLWQMALRVKEDMISAGVNPNTITWSSLISACANAGLVNQAIQLFEEMLLANCEPNTQCCNILLHACVEACQYDRAFRLFQSMKGNSMITETAINKNYISRFNHSKGFMPTSTTYNILMKACGTDYLRAKALIDEMRNAGLSPNHISWSIMIDLCGGSGNVEGAIQILKNMRLDGLKPDVVAYTTAIKICVENKKLQLAFSLFEEMKRFRIQPNLVTYNTILRARSRYGSLHEVQECLAIYQDMRKAGYKSNDYYLKELVEEWCEGVIQGNNQTQGQFSPCIGTDPGRPQGLLLEKVEAHLRKNIAESFAIDLQGLSKVEARIVVLAVLRMIKEKYNSGIPLKDDMLIILGIRKTDANPTKPDSEVKDTIIKLLRDELGLDVILTGSKMIELHESNQSQNAFNSDRKTAENIVKRETEIVASSSSSTRRPVILQRLKVTKRSLQQWLQRKAGASRRR